MVNKQNILTILNRNRFKISDLNIFAPKSRYRTIDILAQEHEILLDNLMLVVERVIISKAKILESSFIETQTHKCDMRIENSHIINLSGG